MADHVYDWLKDKAFGWTEPPPENKIDTHHHFPKLFGPNIGFFRQLI
jgi:hypothetical protein